MNDVLTSKISRTRAFTLPELIIVACVILSLFLLLPIDITVSAGMARRAKTKNDLVYTVAAVRQYRVEYGRFPGGGVDEPQAGVTFGDPSDYSALTSTRVISNERLFNVLRNYPAMDRPTVDENSKQIVFFEGTTAASDGHGNPRGGFAKAGTGGKPGAFYDPWGHQYGIVVDGDGDGLVHVPYKDIPSGVKADCAGWSLGKDGQLGSKGDGNLGDSTTGRSSDDIVSWN